MRPFGVALGATLLAAGVGFPLRAQQNDLAAKLVARGASPAFAATVDSVIQAAGATGLPERPLVNKALEGIAKHAAPDRVLAVMEALMGRLADGRAMLRDAGVSAPSGDLISATAEAVGRGIDRDDLKGVLAAAPSLGAATTGIVVASSLTATGLAHRDAVLAVESAFREGKSSAELLELPSAAATLVARGVTIPDVTRRIIEGRDLPQPPDGAGAAAHAADHAHPDHQSSDEGPGH